MNGKTLSFLFTIALTGTAGAAQAGDENSFNASAERVLAVESGPTLPPVAEQTNYYHRRAVASASGTLDNLVVVQDSATTLAAASILSWTHSVMAFFDTRIVQVSCLARAVYFEARSESQQGQLAVATVILNRVKASNYPSSVCGVVYQGSSRPNACQFSFACDGKPDLPRPGRAWKTALAIAAEVLSDHCEMQDERLQIVSTATHYHADYVEPRWSKSLNRLTKIGHHIFYSQS